MKACDFIRGILQELNSVIPAGYAATNRKGYFLVEIENRLAFKKLHDFLNAYASSQQEVDSEMLEQFKHFLRARWLFIQGTDAIYSHTPYSLSNRAYSILANHISEPLNELPLNLLMPGQYRFNNNYKKKNTASVNTYEMRPQDFTFRDNGQPLIIMLALDNLRKEMQAPGMVTGKKPAPFTQDETARFAFHSEASTHYYAAIVSRSDTKKLDETRETLKKELVTDDYIVTSTYSKAGEDRLLARLLSTIHSQDELVDFLTDIVPKEYWNVFLGRINHQIFFQLMFGLKCDPANLSAKILKNIEDKLLAELNQPALEDISRERALIFCLLEVYQRYGKASPEYSSILGAWVGKSMPSMTGTYPKSMKLEACKGLKANLVHQASIPDKHAGPLSGGVLGMLHARIDNLTKKSAIEMHALPVFMNS